MNYDMHAWMYKHMQDTVENIVYADIGPSSAGRTRLLESASTLTLDLDEHKVEYAQLNHKAHSLKPVSSLESSTNNEGYVTEY